MEILCIDPGTYSVKFFHATVDKRSISVEGYHQVNIDDVIHEFSDDDSLEKIQVEIIKSYLLEHSQSKHKTILMLPHSYTTSRYLHLPVNNKKKAELMLPFQLDENLPFNINQAHYNAEFQKEEDGLNAIVHITEIEDFDLIFNTLSNEQVLPSTVTTELSVVQSLASNQKHNGPYAILDIGHTATKGYFILDDQVVSNHVSHIAGLNIDECIENTYNISRRDAIQYKHQNAYFLTEDQLVNVNEDQRDFALIMNSLSRIGTTAV